MEHTQDPYRLTSIQLGLSPPPHHSAKHQLHDYRDQVGTSDSVSETINSEESLASDCESSVSGPVCDPPTSFGDELVECPEGDKIHDLIKRRFLSCLGSLGDHCEVLSIHRNLFRTVTGQARFQSFQIFLKAMELKHGGNANMRYAWYAGTRNEIKEILEYGFGELNNNGLYGHGFYLCPDNSPMECVRNSVADENGLRYLLLCRVIMGKSEVVHPGSNQSCPSSPEFDSGTDSLTSPKKHIMWSTNVNTHVLPEFVVSFKAPVNLRGFVRVPDGLKKLNSPWLPFPVLIAAVSKFLPPSSVRLVFKYYKEHKERKISRFEMIQQLRRITGDKLLIEIIKSVGAKVHKLSGNELSCTLGLPKLQVARVQKRRRSSEERLEMLAE